MKVPTIFLLGAALLSSARGGNLGRLVEGNTLQKPNLRIVNGEEAVPHSIPYQAYLTFLDDTWGLFTWWCAGALISENYVLTVGHCTKGAGKVQVVLGGYNRTNLTEETAQVFISEVMLTHPEYDSYTYSNDIALVKLPQAANLTSAVNIIALSTLSYEDLVGTVGNISGWGLTDMHDAEYPDTLRVTNVTIVENKVCEKWRYFNSTSQLCTSGPDNRGPCTSDRGDPLVVDGKLAGLTSSGIGILGDCNRTSGPDTYTRISYYLDWIKSNSDVNLD